MKIPDKITLGAIDFTVHKDLDEKSSPGFSGSANATQAVICLYNTSGRPKQKTEQVFVHELVHMIIDTLGHETGVPGPYDEVFVESVSLLLHQAMIQIIKAQSD